eukprot:GSMAST32.ASY1.ANO1.601.1 assembled CDS
MPAGLIEEQVQALKDLWSNKRTLVYQALNLGMIVLSALMIWKTLMVVTKSESPVVVVLSGSMEPAFQRGDILFLNNDDAPVRAGEVVVFKIKGRDIPIVHRVMNVHEDSIDNTPSSIPYLGMVTIILNDYPKFKYLLVGVMGLFVLTNKE